MRSLRKVGVDLDNHLGTSSEITPRSAHMAICAAQANLGEGGIFAVLRYNGSEGMDQRWNNFVSNLHFRKVNTGNGVYLPEPDILVLHGQEVNVRGKDGTRFDMHVVGHPPHENIPHGISPEGLCDFADAYNAWKGAAAPCHDKGSGEYLSEHPELARRLNGVEVYSASAAASFFGMFPDANERAMQLFVGLQKHNRTLFPYVGTDGHSPCVVGRAHARLSMPGDYMVFENNPIAVMANLKGGYCSATPERDFVMRPARVDAYRHAANLVAIVGQDKLKKLAGKA